MTLVQPIILSGDCLPIMRTFAANQTSAIITDPPYGLADHKPETIIAAITAWASGDRARVPDGKGFMGNNWDTFVPPPAVWDECYRILRPGAYLAVFGGSRMVDLLGLSIRLAGFEIRDTITWCYGSGFPKSLDISKAIDKIAGAQREVIGLNPRAAQQTAKQWEGWGTALKPAIEPIILARKPFPGTVATNVLTHGTGGLNIDGCRVDTHLPGWKEQTGRWPANMVLSHTSTPDGEDACTDGCVEGCPVAELDEQSGTTASTPSRRRLAGSSAGNGQTLNHYGIKDDVVTGFTDSGGASRFFPVFRYQAKAPKAERPVINGKAHPTVKPQALIEWLVTLLTPPRGIVIDPFAGSGTLGAAAYALGFTSILIENNPEYIPHIYTKLGLDTIPSSA